MKTLAQPQVHITLVNGRPVPPHYSIKGDDLDSNFHFSITPSLPVGLAFDSSTGSIRGTPVACSIAQVHTLICHGFDGSSISKKFFIEIIDLTPSAIGDGDSAKISELSEPDEFLDAPPRRCASDPLAVLCRHVIKTLSPKIQSTGWGSVPPLHQASVSFQQFQPSLSPPSCCGTVAAVLLPLGPQLALALCDSDEARRALRGKRMGRAAFIGAGEELDGQVPLFSLLRRPRIKPLDTAIDLN